MNTMFKKSLLALTVAGLSTAAVAKSGVTTATGTIVAPATIKTHKISSEGVPATKATTLADVVVDLKGADQTGFVIGGKVKLTFTGAFVNGTAGTTVVYADVGGNTTVPGVLASANGTATSTTLTSDAWTTAPNDNATPANVDDDTVTFNAIPLLLTSSDAGHVVQVTAEILGATGVPVASATSDVTTVADLVQQFDVTTDTKLNEKIDVANERKTFELKATSDTLTLDFTETGSGATETEMVITVAGNMQGVKSIVDQSGNKFAIDTVKNEATFTYDGTTTPAVTALTGTADFDIDFSLETVAADQVELVERSFTYSVDLEYTDADTVKRELALAAASTAGGWTLNGDSSVIEYLPYGANISQIIYVSNKGDVDGEISFTAFDDMGNEYGPIAISTKAAANSVTGIAGDVKSGLMAEGFSGEGKVYLDFEVNSPDGDITIYGSYNVSGDRVTVSNK